MPSEKSAKVKLIMFVVLASLCAWLVYRNILSPTPPNASASPRADSPPAEGRTRSETASGPGSAGTRSGERNRTMDRQELAAMDPTLRLDLLEKSRQVTYEGGSRNIFQPYIPPPPKNDPILSTPAPASPSGPLSAPRIPIPLKFYGMAVRPETNQKKAFLTDGEEIFIGEEGSLIAKQYKIIRIGVNFIELEDTQSNQRQQLPLLEN